MNIKMSSKTKIIIANVLLIFGFLCVVSGFLMLFIAREQIFGIVSMFVAGVISIIIGSIIWTKSGHPVVEEPKKEPIKKVSKPKKYKPKKQKTPFMTDKEWKEEEEEDDEMMFIEEIVEDD